MYIIFEKKNSIPFPNSNDFDQMQKVYTYDDIIKCLSTNLATLSKVERHTAVLYIDLKGKLIQQQTHKYIFTSH